jgi:hypothetical protein
VDTGVRYLVVGDIACTASRSTTPPLAFADQATTRPGHDVTPRGGRTGSGQGPGVGAWGLTRAAASRRI